MLRATGHAHMVTSNGISAEKLLGVAAHFHIQKLLKLRGCRFAAAFTKSIAYKLSRDFSFSSFPGA